ncbi:MAG: hypothetical protein NVSMB52_03260 [Chloroflexota bacterium]
MSGTDIASTQPSATVDIPMTTAELGTLVTIANFYRKNMGPMRLLVGWTTGPETREKLQFVADESRILHAFAVSNREKVESAGLHQANVTFTVRALIAFWGRLLASLRSSHARRRLRQAEIERRERLACRLQEIVKNVLLQRSDVVEEELSTRRASEQEWMRELLWPNNSSAR